jgi:hypothetical protein
MLKLRYPARLPPTNQSSNNPANVVNAAAAKPA